MENKSNEARPMEGKLLVVAGNVGDLIVKIAGSDLSGEHIRLANDRIVAQRSLEERGA